MNTDTPTTTPTLPTAEELAAMRAIDRARTQGEWISLSHHGEIIVTAPGNPAGSYMAVCRVNNPVIAYGDKTISAGRDSNQPNKAFIAHCSTAFPRLLDAIATLTSQLAAARAEVTALRTGLEPFAHFATWLESLYELEELPSPPDNLLIAQSSGGGGSDMLWMADLRTARAALLASTSTPTPEPEGDERERLVELGRAVEGMPRQHYLGRLGGWCILEWRNTEYPDWVVKSADTPMEALAAVAATKDKEES